jgi:hypothetical protein
LLEGGAQKEGKLFGLGVTLDGLPAFEVMAARGTGGTRGAILVAGEGLKGGTQEQRGGGVVGGSLSLDEPTQWYHIAATYGAAEGTLRLYRDGELVGTMASAVDAHSGGAAQIVLGIGAQLQALGSDSTWRGSVAEVRLWASERREEQIAQLRLQSMRGDEEGLLGYWRLNQQEGKVKDEQGVELLVDATPYAQHARRRPGTTPFAPAWRDPTELGITPL